MTRIQLHLQLFAMKEGMHASKRFKEHRGRQISPSHSHYLICISLPLHFVDRKRWEKNTEFVGGHPTMLIQTATNTTSPVIVASDVSLKGYTWDNGNGKGSEKPVKVMIELCQERLHCDE